jgi:hypothetical protein
MSKLTIKLYFSDEIRKITINKDTKYSEFLNQITEFLKKKENKITLEIVEKNYTFQYMDTEGDIITFSSEEEFKDVLENNSSLLKITVKSLKENKEEPKKENENQNFEINIGDTLKNLFGIDLGEFGKNLSETSGWKDKCGNWKEKCGNWRNKCGNWKEKCENWKEKCKEKNSENQVHKFITCDGCQKAPIIGKRFKCNDCDDFDYCSECYEKKDLEHNKTHTFKMIERPRHHYGYHGHQHGKNFEKGKCPYFNQQKEDKEVHFWVSCDGCDKTPIIGDRYKCNDCEDFDYCSDCHKNLAKLHPEGHTFQLIKKNKCTKVQEKIQNENENKNEKENEKVVEKVEDYIEEIYFDEKKPEEIKIEKKEEIKIEETKQEEKKPEEKVEEKYQKECETLNSMGFNNNVLNLHLLNKFNGRVEKVIEMLLKFN